VVVIEVYRVSGASTIPKGGDHLAEGFDGAGDSYQISNPQLDRVIAVVRG
jgi:hypothetical protein